MNVLKGVGHNCKDLIISQVAWIGSLQDLVDGGLEICHHQVKAVDLEMVLVVDEGLLTSLGGNESFKVFLEGELLGSDVLDHRRSDGLQRLHEEIDLDFDRELGGDQ